MIRCLICSGLHSPTQPHMFAALTDAEFLRVMHTETLPTPLTMIQQNKRIKQAEQRGIEYRLAEKRRRQREYVAKYRSIPENAEKHRKACREYMRRRAAKKKLEAALEADS